jgi:hypothetical protein
VDIGSVSTEPLIRLDDLLLLLLEMSNLILEVSDLLLHCPDRDECILQCLRVGFLVVGNFYILVVVLHRTMAIILIILNICVLSLLSLVKLLSKVHVLVRNQSSQLDYCLLELFDLVVILIYVLDDTLPLTLCQDIQAYEPSCILASNPGNRCAIIRLLISMRFVK